MYPACTDTCFVRAVRVQVPSGPKPDVSAQVRSRPTGVVLISTSASASVSASNEGQNHEIMKTSVGWKEKLASSIIPKWKRSRVM